MAVKIEDRTALAGADKEAIEAAKNNTGTGGTTGGSGGVSGGTTGSYGVNYNDQRFTQVNDAKQQAMDELNKTYGTMVNDVDQYYQAQIDATKAWEQQQAQLQQERTDFAIEQIEQQKDQTTKDYKREQSGAYVDWQKESNRYGANAEQMAAYGLANTGYSESSQVSMYNQYQSRVATARESYNTAILNYNNAIKDARLQNNAALAEIAYNSLQQQLQLSLDGFQYKNTLIDNLYNKKTELDNTYYNRYQDVLAQINHENAMAEEIRQYNQNYALNQKKYETDQANWQKEYDLSKAKLDEEKRQYDASLAEEQRQFNEKLAEDKRQHNDEVALVQSDKLAGSGSAKVDSRPSGDDRGIDTKNVANNNKVYEVVTAYYRGDKNADCATFGTFSNGYQPKGISGHGTLHQSGEKIEVKTQTLYGQTQVVVQNVWKAQDGTKWYWEGRQNKYIQL